MSPTLRDRSGPRRVPQEDEIFQRTITVAVDEGVQAVRMTEVVASGEAVRALQQFVQQQPLRATVGELSAEFA
eukprot:11196212-Lingulodinium_polyedra.AAC.1